MLSYCCAICLLAICGLLLRIHVLISAARSPNFVPLDPSFESDNLSTELSFVIGLLILLLVAPALLAIILLPSAQSAFRDGFAALQKTRLFNRMFAKPSSSMQSTSLEARGSSDALNTAAGSSRREDIAIFPGNLDGIAPPVDFDQIDAGSVDFSNRLQLSARRTTSPYPFKSESSL